MHQIGFTQTICDLGANGFLAAFHPSLDHFLPDLCLMRRQHGSPEFRRIEPPAGGLLSPIPLRKILVSTGTEDSAKVGI